MISSAKAAVRGCRYQSTISKNHLFVDLNSIPRDKSKIPTHELLQKLGFVKQPAAGLVHWLPNGLRTIQKISGIIQKRMEEIGFEQVSLSSLSGAGLWEKTGRWQNTELFKLQDSKKASLCLVATCEEEITDIINRNVQSYKQLPVLVYQITRKYRDEKRPRFGLLRGREFIMKDGYSFDVDAASAIKTFRSVNEAYRRIFTDLNVPFVAANADSGDIGGDMSLEWHFLHSSGEDTLLTCSACNNVSNVEKTVSFPTENAVPAQNANVKYYTTVDNSTLVAVYYPSDRTLTTSTLKAEIDDIVINHNSTNEQVLDQFKINDNSEIAVKSIVRVIDPRVTAETNLPDFPQDVAFQRNSFTTFNDISVVEAHEGEVCGECGKGHLTASNAIEVGHTFYLGKRYSKPLNAGFIDKQSTFQLFEMGCYGIGVSRLLAAIAEVKRDEKGLCWPASVAPYHVTVVSAKTLADSQDVINLVKLLRENGIDTSNDTRNDLPLPFRIRESQIIGIPLVLIVGKRFPTVEIEVRAKRDQNQSLAWKQLHETNHENWQWEVLIDKDGIEKHFVHKDAVVKVVQSLLKDL